MLDATNHSWNASHCFIVRYYFFVLDPGSSFQMPIEHFHMHVLLSAETFISYLDLLLISPPLFSTGDLPLSQSLRDTATRHRSLFPLHSLPHLISHGVLFILPLACPFLPPPMATALHWLIVVIGMSLFPSLYLPPSQTTPHILARLI